MLIEGTIELTPEKSVNIDNLFGLHLSTVSKVWQGFL
jgi:hypothetical protein